jgi:GTPase SAR1 family protein
LTGLQSIGLSNSQISDIRSLEKLTGLQSIDLRGNKIKEIPQSILRLNMDISMQYDFLFKGICLHGNPIESPPLEVVEQGKEAIKDYFKQVEKYGTDILYEGKILIVGEAGAGKSTLFLKLENPEPPLPDTKSTLGVVVKEGLCLSHPEKPEVEMVANLWDFGGQEIQYNLHQYFITSDALYILVSDNRKHSTQWDYWFHIIELLAGKCTVLVIINNNKTISSKPDFEITKYKNRFSNLNILQCDVDFAKNDFKWEYLQKEINNLFAQLPSVNQQVIKPQVELRNALLEKRKVFKYITLDDFFQIKTQEKLTQDEKEFALDYFRRVGIITHFPDDRNMRDIIFLNPNWITQGIYAAISSANEKLNDGQFTEEWIYDFWSKHENQYNTGEQSYLLRLMLKDKFDICYELENEQKTYIIPFLLPEEPPGNIHWDNANNIGIRILYPFMPKAILSRLTVQLSEYIEWDAKTNKQFVWRDGVVLKDENHNSRARVLYDYDPQSGLKYIDMRIYGKNANAKKELLQLIRGRLKDIHRKSFQGINYTELVCCNCEECKGSVEPHYFKMNTIERYLKVRETQIKCEKSIKSVNISDLIGPVYSEAEIKELMKQPHEEEFRMRELSELPEAKQKSSKKKVFFSYSHEDDKLKIYVDKHLASLKQSEKIEMWHDREIKPGQGWDEQIKSELEKADIILLFISKDFNSSKYIRNVELPKAIDRHNKKEAVVVPIFACKCDIKDTPYEKLQGLPNDCRCIDNPSRKKKDELCVEVANGIRRIIEE